MKRIVFWCILGAFLCAAMGLAVLLGYFISDRQITPLAQLIPRVERKIAKMQGAPSELEQDMALIETTFVQLRGKVMRPPGIDWTNGGALTSLGDTLIIMDRQGRFYQTDGETQIAPLPQIEAPQNGLQEYAAFAASPEGQALRHNPRQVRFNDVTWIDGARRGLATSYTFYDSAGMCHGTRVAFADVAGSLQQAQISAADWTVIFETQPCLPLNINRNAIEGHMAGGRMAFAAPQTLYLGSGDYHLDGIHARDAGIQSDETSYGKVIAINLQTGQSRIVSKGHRNLQGVTLDGTGRLWVTEHGIRGGDELNQVVEGGNYGWPETTLGTLYSGQPVPQVSYGHHDVGIPPTYAWLPSAAISSLTALEGLDPAWDGDLLAGSLSSAAFGRSLWRIRLQQGRVIFVERIQIGHRIRYVTQFGQRIALWLDSNDLVLFDVTRRPDALAEIQGHVATSVDQALAEDVMAVLTACNECHSYAESEHLAGPSLNGVVGRSIAGTGFTGYSDSLKSMSGKWDRDRLADYLIDPEQVAPGTVMPASGLSAGALLDAVIDTLSKVDGDAKADLTYN